MNKRQAELDSLTSLARQAISTALEALEKAIDICENDVADERYDQLHGIKNRLVGCRKKLRLLPTDLEQEIGEKGKCKYQGDYDQDYMKHKCKNPDRPFITCPCERSMCAWEKRKADDSLWAPVDVPGSCQWQGDPEDTIKGQRPNCEHPNRSQNMPCHQQNCPDESKQEDDTFWNK